MFKAGKLAATGDARAASEDQCMESTAQKLRRTAIVGSIDGLLNEHESKLKESEEVRPSDAGYAPLFSHIPLWRCVAGL